MPRKIIIKLLETKNKKIWKVVKNDTLPTTDKQFE